MSSISTFLSLVFPYFASTALLFTKLEFYVWAFCIGFNVAMIFAYVLKSVESKFVNQLFEKEAFDADRAITLSQANVKGMALLRLLLRDKSTLRNVILLADNSESEAQEGDDDNRKRILDFESAKFYINEEKLDRANSLKKGAIKWYLLPVFCAVSIGLAIGVCYLMPIFLNW